MAFSSFYGGRQGASFVIVERFDGIDIRENTKYKFKYFAMDTEGYYIVPLVPQTSENYKNPDYQNWGPIPCDGVTTVTSKTGIVSDPLPLEYQQGMVQCFSKGGDTVDRVNYGEYVIIDPINKDDPDNGKVYRRGMNYTGELGGAEYIGQIVGPKGSAPKLTLTNLSNVSNPRFKKSINVSNNLVPGKNGDAFNDDIKFAWKTLKDASGNIGEYLVGFQIPYTVIEVVGTKRSPYKPDGTPIDENVALVETIDDGTHPYYRKWKVWVPQGIKGDCADGFSYFPTIVVKGSKLYPNTTFTEGTEEITTIDRDIKIETYWDTREEGYVEVYYTNGQIWYAKIENIIDLTQDEKFGEFKFGYLETKYDAHKTGDHEWKAIGKYKVVQDIEVDNDGTFRMLFTCDDPIEISKKIRWLDDVMIDTHTSELKVKYNNKNTYDTIGDPINFVKETVVANDSTDYTIKHHLLVEYSDPTRQGEDVPNSVFYRNKWWQDLGYIKGEIGGVRTIGNVDDISDLIPGKAPEDYAAEGGLPGQPSDYMGWLMTVGGQDDQKLFFAYNYFDEVWYYTGQIDAEVNPKTIFMISETAPVALTIGGVWAYLEEIPSTE